jgi:transglutaminase-like putative cysteine protease
MSNAEFAAADSLTFIDYSTVDWSNVRRTRCLFNQRFHYAYPGPIHHLRQRLMVIPADRYGTQQVCSHALSIDPPATAIRQHTDSFGNRVLELDILEAHHSVLFDVSMIIESEARASDSPSISLANIDRWLQPTRLTAPNAKIETIAQQLRLEANTPYALAQRISDWVFDWMRYESAVTTVDTTAGEALMLGRGLCQDYSHLMLSICRVAGLPARYVSGHLLGEGGSHAWVEVVLPTDDGFGTFAFDPTNNRHPDLGYLTVAVGRDYRDVSPTSGSFVAPYGGQLTCSKRAGLILVEYLSGDIVRSQPIL